uniref:Uncharacterized protein n=1 Tax=Trachydiscus minutus TaxID=1032745 RepID=A0A140F2Q1_9STRA|nr:hypothetical protein [Trachydiscus minutus]AML60685.1 hypothetical protein [Trachydiscus minutus]
MKKVCLFSTFFSAFLDKQGVVGVFKLMLLFLMFSSDDVLSFCEDVSPETQKSGSNKTNLKWWIMGSITVLVGVVIGVIIYYRGSPSSGSNCGDPGEFLNLMSVISASTPKDENISSVLMSVISASTPKDENVSSVMSVISASTPKDENVSSVFCPYFESLDKDVPAKPVWHNIVFKPKS